MALARPSLNNHSFLSPYLPSSRPAGKAFNSETFDKKFFIDNAREVVQEAK